MSKLYSPYFVAAADRGPLDAWPGVGGRPLVWGARTMLVEMRSKAGTVVDPHSHPHVDELNYLVAGRREVTVWGQRFCLEAGDAFIVPRGVEHGTKVLEDCVSIACFSPPREEWKP